MTVLVDDQVDERIGFGVALKLVTKAYIPSCHAKSRGIGNRPGKGILVSIAARVEHPTESRNCCRNVKSRRFLSELPHTVEALWLPLDSIERYRCATRFPEWGGRVKAIGWREGGSVFELVIRARQRVEAQMNLPVDGKHQRRRGGLRCQVAGACVEGREDRGPEGHRM